MRAERPRRTLIAARSARGLTQCELAGLVGVAQTTISRVERGECMPDARTARRLMSALGVTLDEIVGRPAAQPSTFGLRSVGL